MVMMASPFHISTVILATIALITLLVSTVVSSRLKSVSAASHDDHRQLVLTGFNDPKTIQFKTIQLRPDVNYDYTQTEGINAEDRVVCDQIDLNIDPGEVNRLRRRLAHENPPCFQRRFSDFANHFRTRINDVKNHLNLHIPKAGGTAFCSLARSMKDTFPLPDNCFSKNHEFGMPLWCCSEFADRQEWDPANVCNALDQILPEFSMNENYLDHPLCQNNRLYSILLRNPVDRAMSQERHLSRFSLNGNWTMDKYSARLELTRKNYMTWALTSGLTDGEKATFIPQREHMDVAKDILSRFDFLLEFTSKSCLPVMMGLMGFGNATLPHDNVNAGGGNHFLFKFDLEQYRAWNLLDIELYEYARKLALLDCDFFLRLDEEEALIR